MELKKRIEILEKQVEKRREDLKHMDKNNPRRIELERELANAERMLAEAQKEAGWGLVPKESGGGGSSGGSGGTAGGAGTTTQAAGTVAKAAGTAGGAFALMHLIKFIACFLIIVVIPLFVFSWLLDPIFNIFATALIYLFGEQIAQLALGISWAIIIFVGLIYSWKISQKDIVSMSVFMFVWFMILFIPNAIMNMAVGGVIGDQMSVAICQITHPTDPLYCQALVTKKKPAPEGAKIGGTASYKVLDAKLGYKQRDYKLGDMYRGQVYNLPVNIENVNKDEDWARKIITNVKVSGYIAGDNCEDDEKKECIKFVPSECSEDKPCEITSKKSINLVSEEPVNYSRREVKLIVEVSYSYPTDGKSNFYVYQTEDDVPKSFPKPDMGPGPVDIVVFFTPEYASTQIKGGRDVYTHISLDNAGKEYTSGDYDETSVILKKIKLQRMSEMIEFDKAACELPWDRTKTFEEGQEFSLGDRELYREIQFVCYSKLSDVNLGSAPSKSLKFLVNLDYDYKMKIEKEWIMYVI